MGVPDTQRCRVVVRSAQTKGLRTPRIHRPAVGSYSARRGFNRLLYSTGGPTWAVRTDLTTSMLTTRQHRIKHPWGVTVGAGASVT